MNHYVCKGENCPSVSENPSVCLESTCESRYKLLEECNCPHSRNHKAGARGGGISVGLSPVNLGLALGVLSGIAIFVLGIFAALLGWGNDIVRVLSSLYIGYDATPIGSVAGAMWAFVDGFIGGALVAFLYNFFQKLR